jgi:hypothetical protein
MMCCRKSIGACATCGKMETNVLAFVSIEGLEGANEERQISATNVRFCPFAFDLQKREPTVEGGRLLGMTMFHELMHIVSSAGDKGYSKLECVNNAVKDPKRARQNAAAYVYYAQEAGMTRKNFLKATGPPVFYGTC